MLSSEIRTSSSAMKRRIACMTVELVALRPNVYFEKVFLSKNEYTRSIQGATIIKY